MKNDDFLIYIKSSVAKIDTGIGYEKFKCSVVSIFSKDNEFWKVDFSKQPNCLRIETNPNIQYLQTEKSMFADFHFEGNEFFINLIRKPLNPGAAINLDEIKKRSFFTYNDITKNPENFSESLTNTLTELMDMAHGIKQGYATINY